MPTSRIDDLDPEQVRAATAGEGPVLTIAGAGTGKTKTLAARVARLVSQGIDPGRIMLLTFTRRASEEMLRRARRALGETGSRTLGTIGGRNSSSGCRPGYPTSRCLPLRACAIESWRSCRMGCDVRTNQAGRTRRYTRTGEQISDVNIRPCASQPHASTVSGAIRLYSS